MRGGEERAPRGRVVLVETPGLAPVGFEYDARGRLITITEGVGAGARISRITYNSSGYVESATDPLNRTTSFEYDLAGRVTAQIRPDGRRIPFTYDEHGNVTSITRQKQQRKRKKGIYVTY